jgi:hypothetical protein
MPAAAAAQALAGGVSAGQAGLRYKKKMMMWGEAEVGYCMMTFVIRWGNQQILSHKPHMQAVSGQAPSVCCDDLTLHIQTFTHQHVCIRHIILHRLPSQDDLRHQVGILKDCGVSNMPEAEAAAQGSVANQSRVPQTDVRAHLLAIHLCL